jgi:hypothetical protein
VAFGQLSLTITKKENNNMIQLPTPITSSMPQSFDSVWLSNVQISAMDPTRPVRATVTIQPWNTQLNVLSQQRKTVMIPDVYATAASSSYVAAVMSNLFAYVQTQINSGSIAF